ncbi:hypothetical protein [Chelatococcus reniformis]|uniref:Uncharacterized protein n=1 Tax=Chelatococcus reniformis TaxID=1494448 RepID=A0A916UFK8_9HYPH|nr:hypothetical protein [Chelatococcus reniformis]GGC70617.1 hypothetical protein GCM10010994_31460 [Chelatococcus reniformis]
MTDWFRSWHGAPTDPKWRTVARRAGVQPGVVTAIVWVLLDRASQAPERGSIVGYDCEVIADALGFDPEQVDAVVTALHEKSVLVDGRFAGWAKHQPAREDGSAERAKAWREQKKAERTQPNAPERERTPEERREETEDRSSSLRSEEGPLAARPPLPAEPKPDQQQLVEAVEIYNSAAATVGWPKCQKLTDQRRAALRHRLKDCCGIDGWRAAMDGARASPFLTGRNDRGWTADLDFFLQAKSFTRLMEGGYDRRGAKPTGANVVTLGRTERSQEDRERIWRLCLQNYADDSANWRPDEHVGFEPGTPGCHIPPEFIERWRVEQGLPDVPPSNWSATRKHAGMVASLAEADRRRAERQRAASA